MVNQAFAEALTDWNEDAIGQQIRVPSRKDDGAPLSVASPQSGGWREIIGVVADSRNDGLERPAAPAIYVPYTAFMSEMRRSFLCTLRARHWHLSTRFVPHSIPINPDQRISTVDDLEDVLQHQSIWTQQRLFSILFSFFAGLALILSLIGVASIVSFAVAWYSVRANSVFAWALGAQRSHIVWIVVRTTFAYCRRRHHRWVRVQSVLSKRSCGTGRPATSSCRGWPL